MPTFGWDVCCETVRCASFCVQLCCGCVLGSYNSRSWRVEGEIAFDVNSAL